MSLTARIVEARELHQDAILALALDRRLLGPGLVDAAADDFDRLLDGLAHAVEHRGLRNRQADHAAAGIGHLKVALTAGSHQSAQRLGQLAQLGERRLHVGFLGDANLDRVVAHGDAAGEADLGIAQRPADVVADLVEPLLLHIAATSTSSSR